MSVFVTVLAVIGACSLGMTVLVLAIAWLTRDNPENRERGEHL